MSDIGLVVRDKVLPLVLPSSAEELQDPEVIRRTLAPGVELLYAVHAPVVATWFGMTKAHLQRLGLADEGALHALALHNLGALDLEVEQHDGFVILFCRDLPAASFALRPELWRDRVPSSKDSTPLVWAAAPGVLLCLPADAPRVRQTLADAAAALLDNEIVEEFLVPMPWFAGDPPKLLPWAVLPHGPSRSAARHPEDGPPEAPFALHMVLLVTASVGLVGGGMAAWRPWLVSSLGEHGMFTTSLAILPFLIGAVLYALADPIRPAVWRGSAKLAAWAALGAYAMVALTLHLAAPTDASPVSVGLTVAGALACAWYIGGYTSWLVRRA